MEKCQQRVIIHYFSLKGWGVRKIHKEMRDTLRSDQYSQAQISRWLARFSTGDISSLDEARPGRPRSILGARLEHFLEKFPFASVCIMVMHFNGSHSTIQDISSRELGS
jgi:transposase